LTFLLEYSGHLFLELANGWVFLLVLVLSQKLSLLVNVWH
jgi:hypothetical protein